MHLVIEDPARTLTLLRRARQQCQVRVVQLSSCRICAADQKEFEELVGLLKDFEHQLENQDATHQELQSG